MIRVRQKDMCMQTRASLYGDSSLLRRSVIHRGDDKHVAPRSTNHGPGVIVRRFQVAPVPKCLYEDFLPRNAPRPGTRDARRLGVAPEGLQGALIFFSHFWRLNEKWVCRNFFKSGRWSCRMGGLGKSSACGTTTQKRPLRFVAALQKCATWGKK